MLVHPYQIFPNRPWHHTKWSFDYQQDRSCANCWRWPVCYGKRRQKNEVGLDLAGLLWHWRQFWRITLTEELDPLFSLRSRMVWAWMRLSDWFSVNGVQVVLATCKYIQNNKWFDVKLDFHHWTETATTAAKFLFDVVIESLTHYVLPHTVRTNKSAIKFLFLSQRSLLSLHPKDEWLVNSR
jgi:hypothetical protein